ncbi:MAG: response regulator [Anaerolineae bacterium]|nr:response regulator [Anaerolineae bacterium]
MANELVLIIDDALQTINFVTDYVLKPNNYQVLVAQDGQTGLKLAIEQQPDLILLDMSMAKMSGMEVLSVLNARNLNIPVIVMTFHGSETLAVQAFRMGIKDYILKPFTVTEMLASIERSLAEARLRQERDRLTDRLIRSNHALEKRLKELNTIFGIGKSVTSLLDQKKLLSRLVEAAIYLTDAEEGSLLLVDPDGESLTMVTARGIDERVVRSFRTTVSDSLPGSVVLSGDPLILPGDKLTAITNSYSVRSLLYVPLKTRGQVGGVLGVNNRHQTRTFTNHDLRLLSTLADYAAISMENAQLFNEVNHERNKLAAVLGEITEPVVVINSNDDRIVVANAAFGKQLGLDGGLIEDRSITDLVQNPTWSDFISTRLNPGSSHKGELPLADGRTFYATLTAIPEVGRAIIMQDVTHFKDLSQMKSDFVSTVAGDLQAPLNSIKAYAEMLSAHSNLDDKQKLFVERITNGLDQVTRLVDNLLDLNTIEMGADPALSVVDLSRLVEQAVAQYQARAGQKHQQLIYHQADQPTPVLGNPQRLQQAINNLIDNALKFTPEEGHISALVQIEDKQVVFKLEDNGIGIPPANLPLIFDKFFRTEETHRSDQKGAGLGLAISKAILERYHGYIWAESTPNQGSTFTFVLPLFAGDELNLSAVSQETLTA